MSGEHFCFTSPDDPEPLECEQCAVFAERADYWRDAAEKRDAWLDAEMDRRRAAEAEVERLRRDWNWEMDQRCAAQHDVLRLQTYLSEACERAEKWETEYARIAGDYAEETSALTARAEKAEAEVERLRLQLAAAQSQINGFYLGSPDTRLRDMTHERDALRAEVERLREAANFAANAADGFRAELEQLRYDHKTEIERLTQERDAFIEMNERLTADLEALRCRVFVRR